MRGVDAARARALDRARLDLALGVEAQEALGRCAGDGEVAELEEGGEGRGVDAAEALVERPGRLGERRFEALGEIRLEDVAGDDVLAHACEGVEVAAVRERRAEIEMRRQLGVGHGVGRRVLGDRRGAAPELLRIYLSTKRIRCQVGRERD